MAECKTQQVMGVDNDLLQVDIDYVIRFLCSPGGKRF